MLARPARRELGSGAGTGKASSWRGALLLMACVALYCWFYRHDVAQRQEILLSQRVRDQFETMYEELLRDEASWRGELDGLRVSSEKLQAAFAKASTELQNEFATRKMVQEQLKFSQTELIAVQGSLTAEQQKSQEAGERVRKVEAELAGCRAEAETFRRREEVAKLVGEKEAKADGDEGEPRDENVRRQDDNAREQAEILQRHDDITGDQDDGRVQEDPEQSTF